MVSTEVDRAAGCHECGRAMVKAKKVHNHCRYCESCYARLFKRRLCPGCGNFGRLPIFDLAALCGACERAGPCVRCGKTEFAIGMRSEYGPVCKSCVPYFREPEPCQACGKLSQRLAVSTKTGLRSCNKCRETTGATCPSCMRYRVLIADHDGVLRCKACIAGGERPCESCGVAMPAGRARTCETCYWTSLFNRRVAVNLAGFTSPRIQQLYESFSQWLLMRNGPHKAALNINVHYSFFAQLDDLWGEVPTYDNLLKAFGAAGLRQAENPMRWLQEIGAVIVSAEKRDEHTEQRRVSEMLSEFPDFWSNQLLHGYHAELALRIERSETDLRSVRIALRAALNFLKHAGLAPQTIPKMKVLEAFWRSSPGQVAAVTGFVGYLNKSYNAQLRSRPEKRWLEKARRDKAERELVALLKGGAYVESETIWIGKALAYFHNIRRVNRKTLVYRPESFKGEAGFSIEYEGQVLWVPSASTYTREPAAARATPEQRLLERRR